MTIRELRISKKMTRKDLATAAGVNISTISRYESGKLTPSIERLELISTALGVEADVLIQEYENSINDINKQTRHMRNHTISAVNEYVQKILLMQVQGKCELCGYRTFLDTNGCPYLEPYLISNSYNGPSPEKNIVLLCPNCHKKILINHAEFDIGRIKVIANSHSLKNPIPDFIDVSNGFYDDPKSHISQ